MLGAGREPDLVVIRASLDRARRINRQPSGACAVMCRPGQSSEMANSGTRALVLLQVTAQLGQKCSGERARLGAGAPERRIRAPGLGLEVLGTRRAWPELLSKATK